MKIRHAGIVVSNLPKAIHFYCEILGFHITRQGKETGPWIDEIFQKSNMEITTIKFEEGLELIIIKQFRPIKWIDFQLYDVGISHISFTVKNIHAVLTKLEEAKIPYISSLKTDRSEPTKVFFCRDYDGNYLEFVEES